MDNLAEMLISLVNQLEILNKNLADKNLIDKELLSLKKRSTINEMKLQKINEANRDKKK